MCVDEAGYTRLRVEECSGWIWILRHSGVWLCRSIVWWTRRELNPRPNGKTIGFLHAYLRLRFRAVPRPEPPSAALSSSIFVCGVRPPQAIPDFAAPPVPRASGRTASGRCLVPAPGAGIKLIYCTSIKQRERSCFRQLNCLRAEF